MFFVLQLVNAQSSDDQLYSITYLSTFKLKESQERYNKEYVRLMVNNEKSIFQTYNSMIRDTLKSKEELTGDLATKYCTPNIYAIEMVGNSLTYYDEIDQEEYVYKEKIDFELNKLKKAYSALTLNEKLSLLNNGANVSFRMTSLSGEEMVYQN